MRVNLYRPVHVQTLASQKHRVLLRARETLQEKTFATENDVRSLLRDFGLQVGSVGTAKFDARILELVEGLPDLEEVFGVLLAAVCVRLQPSWCIAGVQSGLEHRQHGAPGAVG